MEQKKAPIKKVSVPAWYLNYQPIIGYQSRLEKIYQCSKDLKADGYIAHDFHVAPVLKALKQPGKKVICDVVEIPGRRNGLILPTWPNMSIETYDMAIEEALRQCDQLITIGPALAKKLKHYHRPITVLPNYRYHETLHYSDKLRKLCKLNENDKIILVISLVTTAFDNVLKAMQSLPNNHHLVFLGKFVPPEYEEKMLTLVKSLGLSERFHMLGMVPYEELISTASCANVGLIVRDPIIPNNYISFPNRIFDLTSSGLPIVTPYIPDIAKVVKRNHCGIVIPDLSANSWKQGIQQALESNDKMRKNALTYANKHSWEDVEHRLIKSVSGAKDIVIIALGDMSKNNRTIRMSKSLANQGINIKIVSLGGAKSPPPFVHKNVQFIPYI